MYNEELKQRYINYKESSVTIAKDYLFRLFRDSEPYENRKNKDISNFSAFEIKEFYQMLNRTSVESLSVMNSILSQYTNWCQMQNLVTDNQNHFLEISRDNYAECVNTLYVEKSILSRQRVLDMTIGLENYCDKFVLLALFEGISGKEYKDLWKIHYSDINTEMQTITLDSGRTIQISSQLINYAYESGKATEYYAVGDSPRKYAFLETDDTVIKSYMNCKLDISDHQMGRRVYAKVQRLVSHLGMDWLRPQNFIDSGKIDFVNTHALELGMSGENYVLDHKLRKQVENQYGCMISRSNFISRFGQFLV